VRVGRLGLVGRLRGKVLISKVNKVCFFGIIWLRLRKLRIRGDWDGVEVVGRFDY